MRAFFSTSIQRPLMSCTMLDSLQLGVDSLVAVELRNWFRQKVGLDMSVIGILGSVSIAELGEKAMARLVEKHTVAVVEEEVDAGNEKYLKMKVP